MTLREAEQHGEMISLTTYFLYKSLMCEQQDKILAKRFQEDKNSVKVIKSISFGF